MAFSCGGPLTLAFDLFGIFPSPFKEKLLQADTAYLKADYTGVIDELEGVAPNSLPTTQKYPVGDFLLARLEFLRGPKEGHPQ